MQKIIKNSLKITAVGTMALILSACGDSSCEGSSGSVVLGVSQIAVPDCNSTGFATKDARSSQAAVVSDGTVIYKQSTNAEVRVWHFQNGTKAVCMLNGQAEMEVQ